MLNTTFARAEAKEAAARVQRRAAVIAALMAAQSSLGLAFRGEYRDVEWIRATWFGNDWVTLVVAVPLLLASASVTARGSRRGLLVTLGLFAFAVYNYAYYLFGADLNVFFPLYVALCVVAAWSLIASLATMRASELGVSVQRGARRAAGSYFVAAGAGLVVTWTGMWFAYAFFGSPTPVDTDVFKLVAALDLSLMAPPLTVAGVLLWRGRVWGYVIGVVTGVQASLYLIVLSANSLIAVSRDRVEAPGEVPVWGTLALLTIAATLALVRDIREVPRRRQISHAQRVAASEGGG